MKPTEALVSGDRLMREPFDGLCCFCKVAWPLFCIQLVPNSILSPCREGAETSLSSNPGVLLPVRVGNPALPGPEVRLGLAGSSVAVSAKGTREGSWHQPSRQPASPIEPFGKSQSENFSFKS